MADATNDAQVKAAGRRFRFFSQSYSRGDKILFAAGIALSAVCAFFPWYVFNNQDQFGIRAVKLSDIPSRGEPPAGAIAAGRIEAPIQMPDTAQGREELDMISTATVDELDREKPAIKRTEQTFPVPLVKYNVVHIANGRAMIEDDGGIFVVQKGSTLPDSSRVSSIEQRGKRWVVVTTNGDVLEAGG